MLTEWPNYGPEKDIVRGFGHIAASGYFLSLLLISLCFHLLYVGIFQLEAQQLLVLLTG